MPVWHEHPDAAAAAFALANRVEEQVRSGIAADGRAVLAVSGGRSPILLFEQLASRQLDWNKVSITLADERWVPPDDPRSNERLIRHHLLVGHAAAARFIGLYHQASSPEAGAERAGRAISAIGQPFDIVLLGMGEDGHTASLFPDAPELAKALAGAAPCAVTRPASMPEARITLTLPTLVNARCICIAIAGAGKRAVLDLAMQAGPVDELPVRAVLRAAADPVHIFWSP